MVSMEMTFLRAMHVAMMGFSHNIYDNSLFISHHTNDITYILLYVDDIAYIHQS